MSNYPDGFRLSELDRYTDGTAADRWAESVMDDLHWFQSYLYDRGRDWTKPRHTDVDGDLDSGVGYRVMLALLEFNDLREDYEDWLHEQYKDI